MVISPSNMLMIPALSWFGGLFHSTICSGGTRQANWIDKDGRLKSKVQIHMNSIWYDANNMQII
jgi:hypothetical protein